MQGEAAALTATNRRFYDGLWSRARLVAPERFGTWAVVRPLLEGAPRRLEIGPGLRPRLPVAGTSALDLSFPAVAALRRAGSLAAQGLLTALPYAAGAFDLVCALDVVEHVADDEAAFAELARVTAPGGTLLVSVPLHPALWTEFDTLVGHGRRYEPERLASLLGRHGFTVAASAVNGMKPRSNRLVGLGMWCLTRQPRRAMWWYNRVLMPIGLRRDQALRLAPGLVPTGQAETVLLVCRRTGREMGLRDDPPS